MKEGILLSIKISKDITIMEDLVHFQNVNSTRFFLKKKLFLFKP